MVTSIFSFSHFFFFRKSLSMNLVVDSRDCLVRRVNLYRSVCVRFPFLPKKKDLTHIFKQPLIPQRTSNFRTCQNRKQFQTSNQMRRIWCDSYFLSKKVGARLLSSSEGEYLTHFPNRSTPF